MDLSSPPRPTTPSDSDRLQLLTDSLKANGAGRIDLRGKSMLPTLREGWKLQIRSLPAKDLRVGDIGIFVHRGILTIHRLVWKLEADGREWYMFQGDNNPQRETVEADAVLGRVEAAEWEESRPGGPISTPVGKDGRAFFYRTAFRVHSFIASLIPSVALPAKGRAGSFPYRCLRACFRLLEPLFSPRPRG